MFVSQSTWSLALAAVLPLRNRQMARPEFFFFLSVDILTFIYGDLNDLNKQTANARSTTPSCINDTNYWCQIKGERTKNKNKKIIKEQRHVQGLADEVC